MKMKKFIHYNKNFKVIFSCVAIVLLVCTTSIMAYLADADKASNDLVIGGSNIQLVENFVPPSKLEPGITFPKDVKVKNEGISDCYVRVFAEFSDSDIGKYCEVDWNTADWVYNENDGYWYYPASLPKGAETPSLLTQITLAENIPASAIKDFNMLVYAESYQSKGFTDYEEAWANFKKNEKDEMGPSIVFSILGGMSSESPAYTNNSNYTAALYVSDSGTGVKSVSINGVSAVAGDDGLWTADITLEKNAVNKVTATATDNSDNVTTLTKYICFDDVKPELTVKNPDSADSANPTLTRDANYTVSGTVKDEGSGAKRVAVDGADTILNEDGVWEKTISLEENKATAITITAYDYAGNETAMTRYVIYKKLATFNVNNHLTNAVSSNDAMTAVEDTAYETTITAEEGFILDDGDVIVTMGEEDVTASVYADGKITIDKVTGDLVITVVATEQFTVTNDLTNATSDNAADLVKENESYTANLMAAEGFTLDTVNVTMDGIDISATAYADGKISIDNVTGDLVITVVATKRFTVTNALTNVTSDNAAEYARENDSYSAILRAADGYTLDTVTVIMNDVDITATAYADSKITIDKVTGDLVITGVATKQFTVENQLTNVNTDNTADFVEANTGYTASLTAADGYTLDTVTVTMGGVDVTSTVYAEGKITIDSVTGDIEITASAIANAA